MVLGNSHTSQWKDSTSIFLNKEGNILFRVLNEGCPKGRWWFQISSLFELTEIKDRDKGSLQLSLSLRRYSPSVALACPIILPLVWSWKTQWSLKNVTWQLRSWVILWMDSKLTVRLGTCNTILKMSEEEITIIFWPATVINESSATLIFLLLGHGW